MHIALYICPPSSDSRTRQENLHASASERCGGRLHLDKQLPLWVGLTPESSWLYLLTSFFMSLSTKQVKALRFTSWMPIIAYNNFRGMHNSAIRLRLRFYLQEAIGPVGAPSHFFFPTDQVRWVCVRHSWVAQLLWWTGFTKMTRGLSWGWRDGSA